jgi:hypothetical protein
MLKKFLTLSFFALALQAPIFAQTNLNNLPKVEVSEKGLSDAIKSTYRDDAFVIAARLLQKSNPLAKQPIEIPKKLVDFVYATLTQTYTQHPKLAEDLSQKYGIFTFKEPVLLSLIVLIPKKDMENKTALAKVEKDVRSVYKGSKMGKVIELSAEQAGVLIEFDKPVNTKAIAHLLFTKYKYGSIEEKSPIPEGSNISFQQTQKGWTITHKLGFGKNCFSTKCSQTHEWEFLMDEKGAISLQGEKGDAIPADFKPESNIKRLR